ncbi:DciA family protein [Streptomyces sp. NPDC050485]|uniref:DciA family protein n=1 Tax=Streptomyces sp. NPDC050485 TaxID=3365617 RepID=UPI0037BAF5FB
MLSEAAERLGGVLAERVAVSEQWKAVTGGSLDQGISVIAFDPQAGELVVQATAPAWATHIRQLTPLLVTRLNQDLGSDMVRTIRVLPPTEAPRQWRQPYTGPEPQAAFHIAPAQPLAAPRILAAMERQDRQRLREPTSPAPVRQDADASARADALRRSSSARERALARARDHKPPAATQPPPASPTPTDTPERDSHPDPPTEEGPHHGSRHD